MKISYYNDLIKRSSNLNEYVILSQWFYNILLNISYYNDIVLSFFLIKRSSKLNKYIVVLLWFFNVLLTINYIMTLFYSIVSKTRPRYHVMNAEVWLPNSGACSCISLKTLFKASCIICLLYLWMTTNMVFDLHIEVFS